MKTWVKLFTEILDDPDIGSLSNEHCGILMKLFALAGKIDDRDDDDLETGRLDTIERIAWSIRCDMVTLGAALDAFAQRGFLDERDGHVLYLTNYSKRQTSAPSDRHNAVAERVQRHRAQMKQTRNEDVTPLHSEANEPVTQLEKIRVDTEERRVETEPAPTAAPVAPTPPAAKPKRSAAKGQAEQRKREIADATQPYFDAYLQGRNIDPATVLVGDGDKVRAVLLTVKQLARQPTPEEFECCTRWKASNPKWQPYTLDAGAKQVLSDFGDWLGKGKPDGCGNGNGHKARGSAYTESDVLAQRAADRGKEWTPAPD